MCGELRIQAESVVREAFSVPAAFQVEDSLLK